MHTKGPKEDPLIDMGYEVRDVDYKILQRALIFFFVFTFAMFGSGWIIYRVMNPVFGDAYKSQKNNLIIPKSPNPVLQDNLTNMTDIMTIRKAETAQLTSTGWTDDTHTHVHIPIEKAIGLLVQRGLPEIGGNTPAVSKGNTTDEKKAPSASIAPPVSELPKSAAPVKAH